jgi:hypothetical protein
VCPGATCELHIKPNTALRGGSRKPLAPQAIRLGSTRDQMSARLYPALAISVATLALPMALRAETEAERRTRIGVERV